jgi:hypothetical protein
LTVRVPAYKITDTLEREFPITQNLQYGRLTLSNPKALLQRGSDRVVAGTSLSFANPLIGTQKGKLYISGIPYFDAKSGAIYLKEPMIDKLEFNGYGLSDYIQAPAKELIQPIINEIFRQTPIYRVDRNSLQGSFVKNIFVQDGELLVTFGI